MGKIVASRVYKCRLEESARVVSGSLHVTLADGEKACCYELSFQVEAAFGSLFQQWERAHPDCLSGRTDRRDCCLNYLE